MRFLYVQLALVLTACSLVGTPISFPHDWRLTPKGESMWRFRFGDAASGTLITPVLASAAQVTAAGLSIDLDEWGGSKSARWTGLTGPTQDNARVWIDVQDASAPGGWRELFGGTLVRRPSRASGEREALGDKYYRLKWVATRRLASTPTDTERAQALQPGGDPELLSLDIGRAVRVLGAEARLTLPYLKVDRADIPDTGTSVKREYRGESQASALDGLLAAQSGWGWTVRPGDRLAIGPPVPREVVLDTAVAGVQVAFRDVVTEGRQNVVPWVWTLPDGQQVRHTSRHPDADYSGPYGVTRYIDGRSAAYLIQNSSFANYFLRAAGGTETALDAQTVSALRDGVPMPNVGVSDVVRVALDGPSSWVHVRFTLVAGTQATLRVTRGGAASTLPFLAEGGPLVVDRWEVGPFAAGDEVRVSYSGGVNGLVLNRLNPQQLLYGLLDVEAEGLYHIPPTHAATASEPGLQPPAGSVRLVRPGESDLTEPVVGTRYLIREPLRTEYLIGESDEPVDAQVVRVQVDRKDQAAVDQAVNTRSAP